MNSPDYAVYKDEVNLISILKLDIIRRCMTTKETILTNEGNTMIGC